MVMLMKNALQLVLIVSFITHPFFAGNCASKAKQEPRREAWAAVAPAAASSKQAQEKTAAASLISIAALSPRDTALAQAMTNALRVLELLSIVIEYLDDEPFLVRTFVGHTDSVSSVQAMNPNEFISSSDDRRVRLWSITSNQSRTLVQAPLSLNNSNHLLASSSDKRSLRVLKLNEDSFILHDAGENVELCSKNRAEKIKTFQTRRFFSGEYGHSSRDQVASIVPLNADEFAIVEPGAFSSTISQWNANTLFVGLAEKKSKSVNFHVLCVAKLDDNHLILEGSAPGATRQLQLWNRITEQTVQNYTLNGQSARFIVPLDSQHFITLTDLSFYKSAPSGFFHSAHSISLWDKDKNNLMKVFNSFSISDVTCMAALNANRFAIGHDDGTVQVWYKDYDTPQAQFKAHESAVTCMDQIDDAHFITGSKDKTIKVWKYGQAGKLKAILQAHAASLKVSTTQAPPATAKK